MTRRRNAAGFTLMEIIVSMAIIGVLLGMTFGVGTYVRRQSMVSRARTDMELIADALQEYLMDKGIFPSLINQHNVTNRLPARIRYNADGYPIDPWRQPYCYFYTNANPLAFSLLSLGPDKTNGTPRWDADNIQLGR